MKNKCDICSIDLSNENYCTTKKDINSCNTFCYTCVRNTKYEMFKFIKYNYDSIISNKPIIHLDKYNDDFAIDDYFFYEKKK